MSGAIRRRTTSYSFNIINYDFPRWHTYEWQNWDTLDAVLTAAGINTVNGVWVNNTAYTAGMRLVDNDLGSIWICNINHTSAVSGTFAADRIAHPTYWTAFSSLPNYRGAWVTATFYNPGDIVFVSAYKYYYCLTSHTSAAAFATDAGKWALIWDATAAVNATAADAASALASKNAAAASAGTASTDAATATTQAGIATGAAGTATTQAGIATGAASSASTSAGTATTQAGIATTAAGTATTQAGIATTQANLAIAAYDSFDDRYLGPKAADPTLDNDGNALLEGALYWNTVIKSMKAYDGALWAVTTGGGGMFKGDLGTTGTRAGDIFRVTEQQLDTNVTIAATENAHAPGPMTIASGITLTVASGGNLVIT